MISIKSELPNTVRNNKNKIRVAEAALIFLWSADAIIKRDFIVIPELWENEI